ncbi:MAG TPA: twin-arginine translocase TatA/TatE family subunit [Gemmatimonadales bacterium]|nr:twin-arginine translocase TatA/TatE family subunit [Gemmatimonadales bacterium]
MPSLGPGELLIVLLIVLLIFGAGKLTDIGRSLGQGIREFRRSVQDEPVPPAPPPVAVASKCSRCGADLQAGARFCSACGQAVAS